MEVHLHGVRVIISSGDLATADVDAVVNAANNHFWMGGGVAGALKRAGGQEIEAEAMAQGPAPVGAAVVTSGGRLSARHVIHAATMGQDFATSAAIVRTATRSALRRAAAHGFRSVAFPALGTGVGGLSLTECARAMRSALTDQAAEEELPDVVQFLLFGEEALDAFKLVFSETEDEKRDGSSSPREVGS
jgi:O-acetyl-ADP-ribose deacetylase (regulator of RNase III)